MGQSAARPPTTDAEKKRAAKSAIERRCRIKYGKQPAWQRDDGLLGPKEINGSVMGKRAYALGLPNDIEVLCGFAFDNDWAFRRGFRVGWLEAELKDSSEKARASVIAQQTKSRDARGGFVRLKTDKS